MFLRKFLVYTKITLQLSARRKVIDTEKSLEKLANWGEAESVDEKWKNITDKTFRVQIKVTEKWDRS